MDDAAEKREARRRRILENSQRRLEKITGIERKSHISFPTICDTFDEFENGSNLEKTKPESPKSESPAPPQLEAKQQPVKDKYRERILVIASLALFVNYYMVIFDKLFDVSEHLWTLKSVFLPIIGYELIELFSKPKQPQSFNLLEEILAQKSNQLVPIFRCFIYTIGVVQDTMLYFFIFVCCLIVRNVIWPFGIKTS